VPYDGANPAHQEQLRELWALAFPGVPCEALKTPQWKDMGWQVRAAVQQSSSGWWDASSALVLERCRSTCCTWAYSIDTFNCCCCCCAG
jgi:hypothetical protein